ncbi:MAG: ABC transporter permease [Oscillospiraceae bacterium]
MRSNRERWFNVIRSTAAIAVALAIAMLLVFIVAEDPIKAFKSFFFSPLFKVAKEGGVIFNTSSFFTILGRMIPIIFTGLAVCVMFSANQFNLAGEGCVMMGAFVAALCAVYLDLPAGLHAVICVLIGSLSCAVVMLIPALLKTKLGASEMVSSLMLNYIIAKVIMHFLNVNFADRSKGSLMTYPFKEGARIGAIIPDTDAKWGIVIGLVMTVFVAIFMYRTKWGYAIRMIGINQNFAKYSGIKVGTMIVSAQVIGGFLAGMGGAVENLGRYSTFLWRDLPGYGWTGVTIAILAKNNPLYVPVAAFFLAYISRGCELMGTLAGIPSELFDIIQSVIFLFFAADQFLSGYRQKVVVKSAKEELAKAAAAKGGTA